MLKKTTMILFSLTLSYTSALLPCLSLDSETSTTTSPAGNTTTQPKSRSPMLYGRIEQLAGSTGAQFPVLLKAETAKLDTHITPKAIQQGQATAYSGSVVSSFPQQFSGTWGGHLKIWTAQMDSICWQLDPEEASRTKQLMTPGREGTVNFDFSQDRSGKIDLEPAQVLFMVPMKDTRMQEQINSMLGGGGQAGGMTLPGMDSNQLSTMMKQVANNMTVPIMVSFGDISGSDIEGVSGNSIKANVLSNTIRQLGPGVLEQQIVTQETQRNNKTGKTRQEFAETVVRFTSQSANNLYVQAAAINYTSNRQFERKLILYGTIRRGQVMPDAKSQLGGLGGLGGLNNMLPGASQFPNGQNPLQGIFPH